MPTGTAGDRRCVRYLLDRLLSSVLNHTPSPPVLSYRTPPYDTKLQATRPREAGTGRRRRVPRLPADRDHTPLNPYTLDGWLPMRPGWWGMEGWRNPTDLPQLRRTRAAAEPAASGQTERTDYVREGRPELEINTDWTGHAKPGYWYGRYYADWDAAHPGAWVRGELVPGGFYGGNWGGSTLSWDANWFSKHGAKMPKGVHYIAPGRSMTRLTEKLNPSDTGVMRLQFRDD